MNFGEIVFRGWIEANNLHPVSLIEKVEAISRLGAAMAESDLASVKRQNTYLATYYYREALKAEAEHYPLPEFFESCRAIIGKVAEAIRLQHTKQVIELSKIKAAALAGKINYKDDNGLPYEQRLKDTLESCNLDLQKITPFGFTQPLNAITNGMIGGQIGIEQLNRIADALQAAQQRCVDTNNSEIAAITTEQKQDLHPRYFKENYFLLFKRLIENLKPETRLADVSFYFRQMQKDVFIYSDIGESEFRNWLRDALSIDIESQLKTLDNCRTDAKLNHYKTTLELHNQRPI